MLSSVRMPRPAAAASAGQLKSGCECRAPRFLRAPRGAAVARRAAVVVPTRAVVSDSHPVPFEKDSEHLEGWAPGSWRQREALQQPAYPDEVSAYKREKEREGRSITRRATLVPFMT